MAYPVYIGKGANLTWQRALAQIPMSQEQAVIQASQMTLIYTSSQPINGLKMLMISPEIERNYRADIIESTQRHKVN